MAFCLPLDDRRSAPLNIEYELLILSQTILISSTPIIANSFTIGCEVVWCPIVEPVGGISCGYFDR